MSESQVPQSRSAFASLGFSLLAGILIASALLTYRSFQRVATNENSVNHTNEVIRTARSVLQDLTDAETGQRGYLITSDARYLEPYESALATIHAHFQRLTELTQDNAEQAARVAELKKSAQARLDTLRVAKEIHERDGAIASRSLLLEGHGKQQMDAVRELLARFERQELELLDLRQTRTEGSRQLAVWTLVTSLAVGLLLVGTVQYFAARDLKTRHEAALSLAQANQELESRVAARTADLALLNESLRRSNRELEQFASVASHDLQEPLRKIQAFGDRLHTRFADTLGEQGRDYVERMQASAQRMRSLIDALLTYSRVTTKAQPFTEVNLEQVAQEVISDLDDRLERTGGHVEVGSLPRVEADPMQLRQLLQNIVGNGLKFHKSGTPPLVRISGSVKESIDDKKHLGPVCEIQIEDNGIGFEEQYGERIFEVFQRLHGRQEYEGTGMGLAICRRIVERHRGSIVAHSTPGQGTRFVIQLPVRQNEETL